MFCLLFWLYRAACGILFPDQGLNPHPLHWKHGVLATGLARAVPRAGISVRSFQTAVVPSCKTEGLGASGVLLWKGEEPWTSRPGTSWLSHDSLSVGPFADCLTCPGTPVPVWRLTEVLRNRVPCLRSASGRRSEPPSGGIRCQRVRWPGPRFAQNQR